MPWPLAVTPTPSPSPTLDLDSVTPGVVGFITIFVITAAVELLALDMTRRIRRVRYRGEFAARREAAEREQQRDP